MQNVVYENDLSKLTVEVNEEYIELRHFFEGEMVSYILLYIDEFKDLNKIVEGNLNELLSSK